MRSKVILNTKDCLSLLCETLCIEARTDVPSQSPAIWLTCALNVKAPYLLPTLGKTSFFGSKHCILSVWQYFSCSYFQLILRFYTQFRFALRCSEDAVHNELQFDKLEAKKAK